MRLITWVVLLLGIAGATAAVAGAPAARLQDNVAPGGTIVSGASTVFIGGLPAARVGDQVLGPQIVGVIVDGSTNVFIGGLPAARIGSAVAGSHPPTGQAITGTVVTGANAVIIGP